MELELLDIPQERNYTFVYYFVKLITCHEYTEFVVYQTKKMSNYDKGVEAILEQLDKLYLKDRHQTAYLAYEAFEKFQRPVAMSMTDFINEFERMYHKLKQHKMELPDGVLAYRLLKSAHLSEQHEQLARATLTELTYENMKGQLKKIFGDPASLENVSHIPSVKVEPVLQVNEREEGTLFNRNSSFR